MQRKRFYDQEPTVSRAVTLLFVFPGEWQALIAEGVSAMAERNFCMSQRVRELRSLGTENVLAIHKSRHRNRSYDQIPAVHKAINELRLLPQEGRVFLSRKMLVLIHHLRDYLQACQVSGSHPSLTTLREAITIFERQGSPETTRYLLGIQSLMTQSPSFDALPAVAQSDSPLNGLELIEDDLLGLRLRKIEDTLRFSQEPTRDQDRLENN